VNVDEVTGILRLLRETLHGLKMADSGGWWKSDPELAPLFLEGVYNQIVLLDLYLTDSAGSLEPDMKDLLNLWTRVDCDVQLSDGESVLQLRPSSDDVVQLSTTSGRVRVRWGRIDTEASQATEFKL